MLKKIFSNELFKGSFILLVFNSFGNVLSYFFQFIMAWMLGPSDYSILATLTSIIGIFGILTLSLQTIVAKRTAELNIKKNYSNIHGLFNFLKNRTLFYAGFFFLAFSLISYVWLSEFLKIPFSLLALTGTFIFGAFLYPIAAGVLQGTKRFKELGISFVANVFFKLVVGVFLVVIGLKVYGAILGFIIGIIISFLIIFPFLKDILKTEKSTEKIEIFSKSSYPAFMGIIILVLLYSLDVVFAKAFFISETAGEYAVISLLGKIILFLSISIGSVMLPINSERFINGGKTKSVFNKTIFLVSIICGISLFLFIFFPEFVVKTLFGIQYLAGSKILLYVGLSFSFISFLNIFILDAISRNNFKFKNAMFLLLGLIIQIILLSLFHQTIKEFSLAFMFSSFIVFLIGLTFSRK